MVRHLFPPPPGPPRPRAIAFRYSENGGVDWLPNNTLPPEPEDRIYISAGGGSVVPDVSQIGVNLQTDQHGNVYAVWLIWPGTDQFVSPNAIGFNRWCRGNSSNCPAETNPEEWRGPETILGIQGFGATNSQQLNGGKTMRASSLPSMTIDPDGNIYVVWVNIGVPGNPMPNDDPDVYMIKSTDGGVNWNPPIRVNQDPIENGADQWQAWIAADRSNGDLVCIFHDSRDDLDVAQTFVALSRDGGDTWHDFKISDEGWPAEIHPVAADYIGIDIQDGKVYPVWSDDRTGVRNAYVNPFEVVPDFALRGSLAPGSGDLPYSDVWGEGNYAYLGTFTTDSGVYIIDISDPSAPFLAATYAPGANHFKDIKVHDGVGYFSESGGGLHIVNLSDPTTPVLHAVVTSSEGGFDNVHNVSFNDGYIYEARDPHMDTVKVIDVSDPSNPSFVRDIVMSGRIHDVTAMGDRLYASDLDGFTHIYDVANIGTTDATLLGSVSTGPDTCWRSHRSEEI